MLEHVQGAARSAAASAYVSTPNVLTLAPEGAENSGNPWHVKEYRAEEFRALCAAHFALGRAVRAVPRAQAARCTSSPCAAGLGSTSTSALRLTKPFYDRFTPAISASDFALRGRPRRSTRALDFVAVCKP